MEKQRARWTLLFVSSLVLFSAAYFYYRNQQPGLHFEPEGLYIDLNYRDVGLSLNACLSQVSVPYRFKENVLLRSNKWFSGWSCGKIGNPDTIISLNYDHSKRWLYYCETEEGQDLVGFHVDNAIILNDIEFLPSWDNQTHRETTCLYINEILQSVVNEKKTLYHCEAGRDRTGAMSGILATLALETYQGSVDDTFLTALECDYTKSRSITKRKYGRIANFIQDVYHREGNLQNFIMKQCNTSHELLQRFGQKMLQHSPKDTTIEYSE